MPRGSELTKYGEMRMVAEYISQTYPDADVYMRLRLGALRPDGEDRNLSPAEEAMLGVFRRWADAVVVTRDEVIVVVGRVLKSRRAKAVVAGSDARARPVGSIAVPQGSIQRGAPRFYADGRGVGY